jgi:hypothetical protein
LFENQLDVLRKYCSGAALLWVSVCYVSNQPINVMYCVKCGNPIPEARLKALPSAKTCVHCSSAQRVAGFPLITGKTEYSALQIVSQQDAARLQKMQARRGTGASLSMTREKRN